MLPQAGFSGLEPQASTCAVQGAWPMIKAGPRLGVSSSPHFCSVNQNGPQFRSNFTQVGPRHQPGKQACPAQLNEYTDARRAPLSRRRTFPLIPSVSFLEMEISVFGAACLPPCHFRCCKTGNSGRRAILCNVPMYLRQKTALFIKQEWCHSLVA